MSHLKPILLAVSFAIVLVAPGTAAVTSLSVTDPRGDVQLSIASVPVDALVRDMCAPPEADLTLTTIEADEDSVIGRVLLDDGTHRGLRCAAVDGISSSQRYGFSFSALALVNGAPERVDVQGRTDRSELCIGATCDYDVPVAIHVLGDVVSFVFPRTFDTFAPDGSLIHVVFEGGTTVDAILGWSQVSGSLSEGGVRIPWRASDDVFRATALTI